MIRWGSFVLKVFAEDHLQGKTLVRLWILDNDAGYNIPRIQKSISTWNFQGVQLTKETRYQSRSLSILSPTSYRLISFTSRDVDREHLTITCVNCILIILAWNTFNAHGTDACFENERLGVGLKKSGYKMNFQIPKYASCPGISVIVVTDARQGF